MDGRTDRMQRRTWKRRWWGWRTNFRHFTKRTAVLWVIWMVDQPIHAAEVITSTLYITWSYHELYQEGDGFGGWTIGLAVLSVGQILYCTVSIDMYSAWSSFKAASSSLVWFCLVCLCTYNITLHIYCTQSYPSVHIHHTFHVCIQYKSYFA